MYLYLISSNEFTKIGITGDVGTRLADLQTGNPSRLTLSACYEFSPRIGLEAALHRAFGDKRVSGEWFRLDPSDIEAIDSFCLSRGATRVEINLRPSVSVARGFTHEDGIVEIHNGWLERKRTGGNAFYWYQRFRERVDGASVKRSIYISPAKSRG
jgi:hypothetical protein